jgi:glycosyltransferase involved in cell wall biosynthesis
MNKVPDLISADFPKTPPDKTGWPWTKTNYFTANYSNISEYLPKISIITPSYNQARYLEKTIRSVLLQNYPNLEYIIIDGKSNDSSVEIIKKYEKWVSYWISEEDNGQADAINKGFQKATGDIFAWLNSDDYYLPGAFLNIVKAFRENPDAHVIVGNGHKVLDTGKIVYTPRATELNFTAFLSWLEEANFMQPSCFFKAEAWRACGPLRQDLYFCLDVDLWLKMSKQFKFAKLNESISHAIKHESAKTTFDKDKMKVETCLLLMEHGGYVQAKKALMRMAEELHCAKKEIKKVRSELLYRVGAIFKTKNNKIVKEN